MADSLVVKNISKSYDTKPVLRDVSIELKQGEAVGLFGPNGAGKTTCFSIVVGLVKTDIGKIYLANHDITNLPMYLRAQLGIGYLPQEPSVFKGLSVQDNIKAILEIASKYNEDINIQQRLEELLDEFSIDHLKSKMASSLSGGERRRLEIARCLACNPKFVMLDEPLAGIDPLAVNDIKNLVGQLKSYNIGILITDHNVRDTLDIVDRAYVIYDGKVLKHGTPEQIINSQEVREVYLGHSFHNR